MMCAEHTEKSKQSVPTPFATFLSSFGTCAGIYILGFCQQRGISTDGIRIVALHDADPLTGLITNVRLDVQLPPDFPEKYRQAVIRAAEQCAVKKHLENPPSFEVRTSTPELAVMD